MTCEIEFLSNLSISAIIVICSLKWSRSYLLWGTSPIFYHFMQREFTIWYAWRVRLATYILTVKLNFIFSSWRYSLILIFVSKTTHGEQFFGAPNFSWAKYFSSWISIWRYRNKCLDFGIITAILKRKLQFRYWMSVKSIWELWNVWQPWVSYVNKIPATVNF